jgi:Na+/H+ antiporter NhaD/arsenite permease-like protein
METRLMQSQSFCIVLIMLVGIIFRRRRQLHVKIMSVAMVWDVILILQIELSRSAILKASNAMSNALALNIHVSIAVSTVILYAFMIYTGRKMLKNETKIRPIHKRLGWTTFTMRILTFITSFWAVMPKE